MKSLLAPLLILLALPSGTSAETAQKTWTTLCVKCHGAQGDGKTPEGKKLRAKDYADPGVQSSFSDAGLLKNLMLGVSTEADVVRMPAYKDQLTVAEAKDLIALIRSFRR